MKPVEGRRRVVIEDVQPRIDAGLYPVKRAVGDTVTITAAVFCDGHDQVAGRILFRHESERRWRAAALVPLHDDLWSANFVVDRPGSWSYTVQGWVDHFGTWCTSLQRRFAAQSSSNEQALMLQDVRVQLRHGALLVEQIADRANSADTKLFAQILLSLRWMIDQKLPILVNPICDEVAELAAKYPDLELATRYPQELRLWVDRERARFSSWYQLSPHAASPDSDRCGTFADLHARLPEIAEMGFDVLCLTPIHPNGRGLTTDGPGSAWSVGSSEGGHKAIHSELGTMRDFERLVSATRDHGMELALVIAFQCSVDHPWVKEHPDWLRIPSGGPDESLDAYSLNFESKEWRALWEALNDVFSFWIRHGVRIFQIDSPHTKALPFWEWCIAEVHKSHPDVIFLADSLTGQHRMYALAKTGFTQSQTYFPICNTKMELKNYFEEVMRPPVSDFFRANLWPTVARQLPPVLPSGGRAAWMQRIILAATLGANYDIDEAAMAQSGSGGGSLTWLVSRLNQIRRGNAALQRDDSLRFHDVDNPQIICYSKSHHDSLILITVNLDHAQEQAGWIDLDLKSLAMKHNKPFDVEDLLTGVHYSWFGRSNYVALRPDVMPAHVLRVTRGLADDMALQSVPPNAEREA